MCGITGIVDLTSERRQIDRELLVRMNDSQLHRGPDEHGLHLEPGIGLGHRRLSIIDLSTGQQPLTNEDDTVYVTYNGEIYNYRELQAELQQCGHVFKTSSDTEVIVHAWEQWGEKCVERFRGMFAFALWDRNRQCVFLARDRLGIKPLYYARTRDGYLIFASELKALLRHPGLGRELDIAAVENYFALGYVPDPDTILKDTSKLAPGFRLTFDLREKTSHLEQYWDVPFRSPDSGGTDVEEELIERLRDAVNVRMIAEVPLGAFLSGGVDSSAVVAMMAGVSTSPVSTCSIGFDESQFDESQYAERVANQYRTEHYTEQVTSEDFGIIDQLVDMYDEPYADSSAIPTYRVCELARKRVTVCLSGDGGDEVFAGYRRHKWHMNEELVRANLPPVIRRPLFSMLGSLYPKLDWAPKVFRAKTTFQAIARDSAAAYLHSVSVVGEDMREQLFSSDFRRDLNGFNAQATFQRHIEACPTDDPLARIQYLDMKTYLPGDILTKVDRASMAHSLEVRVPILDHHFVEWACGLPARMKLKSGDGKHIFKKSLGKYLPNDVLYRHKMGFAVPLARWFRGPLRDRVVSLSKSEHLGDSGVFDMDYIGRVAQEHISGRREHSPALWSLLMFEGYQRNAVNH